MTTNDALAAKLARVASYEASIRPGVVTKLMRFLGTKKSFSAVYRNIGPWLDPRLAKIQDGKVMAKVYGFRVLIIVTTGAKSGQPRTSPLLYVRDGDDVIVIGTNFGQPKHPGWTANLLANPEADITIGAETLRVRGELVSDVTWESLFPQFVEMYPGYRDYLGRRQGLKPRIFALHPLR